jgi:hypothetical protein
MLPWLHQRIVYLQNTLHVAEHIRLQPKNIQNAPNNFVKNKWKSLNFKWEESEEEQEKLIFFTVGVHNHGIQ